MRNRLHPVLAIPAYVFVLVTVLYGCEKQAQPSPQHGAFAETGAIRVDGLTELSGIQAGPGSSWYVHNDEGKVAVHVLSADGHLLATVKIGRKKDKWRNPEDLTAMPGTDGPVLVLADMGDNDAEHKFIRLLMVPAPAPDSSGEYPEQIPLLHSIKLRYPDGPRDCEAMGYDPSSDRLLFLTKRDQPPRLYGLDAGRAMAEKQATLEFLGEVPGFRPPTPMDLLRNVERGAWVSQPTGMDINADGTMAAVITYRSLYLFSREPGESWPAAFGRPPREIEGPPGTYDEAVAFTRDQRSVVVTTEGISAPMYRLELEGEPPGKQ